MREIPRTGKNVERWNAHLPADGGVNWFNRLGDVLRYLLNQNLCPPYSAAPPLLGIHPAKATGAAKMPRWEIQK